MQRAYFIHALSPLHAGTGQAQGTIDLPIARLKGTGIPFLPGSSVKGVLRDAQEAAAKAARDDDTKGHMRRRVIELFGPPVDLDKDDTRSSGAVSFGDARLLALPVRSFHGTFAWVTSPLLLWLARRDLGGCPDIPKLSGGGVGVAEGSVLEANGYVFFEEVECSVDDQIRDQVTAWADHLARHLMPGEEDLFRERFAVADDETMTFLWECCTQVDARVRITEQGVVQEGALWYEESLPAETVLLGVAGIVKRVADPETLLDDCLGAERADLQFGGKATVGRGRVRLVPVKGNA